MSVLLTPSGADDSAAFAAAVAAGGQVFLGPGTFHFGTKAIPAIPSVANATKDVPVTIEGAGKGVTICQFSGLVQQLVGFNYTADYDSFGGITVTDLTVDAAGVNTVHNTGAIVGTGLGGGVMPRINIDGVTVERIEAINVPYGAGSNAGLLLSVSHQAVGERQTSILNVAVDDVQVHGGAFGFLVQAIGPASNGPGTAGTNVFMDHIRISNWWHATGVTPDGTVLYGANCMIGGTGYGGVDILIENGYGNGSPDVGIEIDAVQGALVRDTRIENSWNANLYHTNFRDPLAPQDQRIAFKRCATARTLAHSYPNIAATPHANGTPVGTLVVEN